MFYINISGQTPKKAKKALNKTKTKKMFINKKNPLYGMRTKKQIQRKEIDVVSMVSIIIN